jgi:putative transcriptional regulator
MDLTGKLLIAMPGMGDMRFEHAVVLICAHSGDGAMGLIVNKPADVRFAELLDQLEIKAQTRTDIPVHFGGPVENGRGFVLHTGEYRSNLSTLEVPGGFGMTATMDILEDIAAGTGPEEVIMALGYAGWGPGQLEGEIRQNGWLTCDADAALVFRQANHRKWEDALRKLGVDALALSSTAGRA